MKKSHAIRLLLLAPAPLVGCGQAPNLAPIAPSPLAGRTAARPPVAISAVGLPPERAAALDRVDREGSAALRSAKRLFAEGRLAEAERAADRTNAIWGTHGDRMAPAVAHLLGRIRMRQGRYADAERLMARTSTPTPSCAWTSRSAGSGSGGSTRPARRTTPGSSRASTPRSETCGATRPPPCGARARSRRRSSGTVARRCAWWAATARRSTTTSPPDGSSRVTPCSTPRSAS